MIHPIVRNLIRAGSAAAVAAILMVSAHAQTLFEPLTALGTKSITLPAGNTPLGVANADFNHDGFPDLVVANNIANTISVYLSTASGTLLAPVTYPTCGGPTAVLAEDLDLTGLPDIVVTCNTPSSNVIQVWLNLGNGTFNPTVDGITNIVLGTGAGPVSIVSGDFNNDGHPDLAVADRGDGTVTLFLSNAANDFTYYIVKTLTGLGTPTAITAGKFSTSGNLDLAVTDRSSNAVHILVGDGSGGFTLAGSTPTQAGPNGIVTGDFNHDGFLDLAVVNADAGTVSVLLGRGNNTFVPSTPISFGASTGTGATSILALDVNGDGSLDLLTGDVLHNNVALLMNNGDGTFQAAQNYAVPNGPAYFTTASYNGKPQLAVTESKGAAVAILANNTLPTPVPGGRNFVAPDTIANGNGNMADGIVAADFNNDGFPDLAATYLEDNAVRVLIATGKGKNSNNSVAIYPVGAQPYWIASGDLNNDGYTDLVTANTTDGSVSILMNKADGSGTFSPAITIPQVGRLPYQVAIGDLNGDGIADIAVANYGDNAVTILYGPFNAPFQTVQTLPTCTNPYGVAIGDFRHSGQNDIAVTCFHTAQMEVFLNNGMLPYQPPLLPTSFQSPQIYSTDSNPTSLVIGDFNRDGNLDIVTGNSTANDVSFFAGNGSGGFKSAVNSFALNFPDSIAAGDLNGDGILDIAAVAPNFNQVTVLLGKGDGTFLPRMDFASGQQPWAVALADFNQDGKLDIATANTFNRVNLTIPAYQGMYMKEFPPVPGGNPSLNVMLNSSGTNISLTASPSGTLAYNESVTLTATVAPTLGSTTPTGSVIFEDTDGTPSPAIPLSGGKASLTTSVLGSGTHQITVLYSGDVLYQPNTATGPGFVVPISGTPVALTVTPNPITPTTVVSYSVMIGTPSPGSPNPVGTITLFVILPNGTTVQADGPNLVGTAGTGGVTTFSKTLTSGVPPGNYYIYTVFTPGLGSTYPAGSSQQVLVISQ